MHTEEKKKQLITHFFVVCIEQNEHQAALAFVIYLYSSVLVSFIFPVDNDICWSLSPQFPTLCSKFFVTTTLTIIHSASFQCFSFNNQNPEYTILQFPFIKLLTKFSSHLQVCSKVEIMYLWPLYRENPLDAARDDFVMKYNENANVPRSYQM